jgi:transcriptional regulator with PAS, ATPase and Fis domain
MPSDLLESEFFGHEAGAFTGATAERAGLFEIANHGTIFLDEIGTMPAALQVKLLRTLQESEIKRLGSSKISKIDVRVISATNANLELEIKNQRFREDLFYRLGVMILEIPALRERREDIPLLVNYFVKYLSAELKRNVPVVTRDAMTLLEAYSWPGNVRELENTLERAMIFYEGPITADTLELRPSAGDEAIDAVRSLTQLSSGAAKKAEVEAISRVLAETRGNKSKAARILGISYKTLLNKVKEYELERR